MADRIFIALELPAPHREVAQSLLMRWSRALPQGINWVKPDNLHLTVLFVGDVNPVLLPELCTAVKSAASRFNSFDLSLWGCELYPTRAARLIWIKLQTQFPDIFELPRALVKPLRQLGCEPDVKPLKLHVTLGRIKRRPDVDYERQIVGTSIKSDPLPYSRLSVYKSILRPEGPIYHLIEQFDLKMGEPQPAQGTEHTNNDSGGNNAG